MFIVLTHDETLTFFFMYSVKYRSAFLVEHLIQFLNFKVDKCLSGPITSNHLIFILLFKVRSVYCSLLSKVLRFVHVESV